MFESSKLHCRLHCLGVEVTNGYRGHVFRLGPCFFFPFHKPNYYECAFFLAKPTTHARVVRHTILKRNEKKKPWAQTNNSLPNNHVRHNEASFNSTKWRCPYDNVTYCKFTPNRKQLPKQLPPHFTWHAPEWTCIGSDGSMTVNISWKTHLQMKIQTYQIYFTTIYIGKRSKASRCEAPKSFYANLLGFLADSSGVGGRGGSP